MLSKADLKMLCDNNFVREKKVLCQLPKGIKHTIYSYLTLKEVAMQIMKLSKKERRILEEPCAIVRQNKIFKHKITRADPSYCLMHG